MSEKFEDAERPFAEELVPQFHEGEKLFKLKKHPHVIVRHGDVDVSAKEKLAESVEELSKNKELFSSLEKDGMHVVQWDYVIGGKKNEQGIAESYAIVEKIDGKNLKRMEDVNAVAAKEIDQCFSGYLAHILRIVREGGRYWSDIHLGQIVYGTRLNDPAPHAYVVDIDPYAATWMNKEERENDPQKAAAELKGLISRIDSLFYDIREVERKISPHAQLEMTRVKFIEVITQLRSLPDMPNNMRETLLLIESRILQKKPPQDKFFPDDNLGHAL